MTAGVEASISVNLRATLSGSNDLGTPRAPALVEFLQGFSPGTDAITKANILFADTRTLVASATENLDILGALTDALGSTVSAAEVTAIWIEAADTNTNSVVAFGAASNAFNGPLSGTTPKVTLQPGNGMLFVCKQGWAGTAGTGDIILVANSGSGTSVDYTIVLIGRTTAA